MKVDCDLVELFKALSAYFEKGWKNTTQKEYDAVKEEFMAIYKHLYPPYVNVCDGGTHPRVHTG